MDRVRGEGGAHPRPGTAIHASWGLPRPVGRDVRACTDDEARQLWVPSRKCVRPYGASGCVMPARMHPVPAPDEAIFAAPARVAEPPLLAPGLDRPAAGVGRGSAHRN
ncbi:hypothetical protein GCM10010515_13090 [Streptomyces fructofermentans]|uniref:Uncharacterized protein n=1 Tax=Streptomyces fructofermentans TaxID=152141 RepID=A0A918K403_9ACTN|nr:hypothetical protein GCM10010515_13090 [Streptomyces fructofermentans]